MSFPIPIQYQWSCAHPAASEREAAESLARLITDNLISPHPVTSIRLISGTNDRFVFAAGLLEVHFDPVLPPPTASELQSLLALIL